MQYTLKELDNIQKFQITCFSDGMEVGHGSIIVNYRDNIGADPVGFIEDIWTHEDFRRQGIGSNIVQRLIKIAKDKMCYKVVLFCNDRNALWYESFGFYRWQNGMRLNIRN